ncbi:hypothetical protein FQR65_LT08164 [Abscondita terminalis]|nr:hypothetical protein FQR65_LT08164 [Abscondita terminalis]
MTKPSKKYSLVLFLEDDCDKKSVDVVPTDWLFCDKRGSIYCPFIDDFTSSNISLLEKLVRDRKPPNDAWKTYRVDVGGHAGKKSAFDCAWKHKKAVRTLVTFHLSTDIKHVMNMAGDYNAILRQKPKDPPTPNDHKVIKIFNPATEDALCHHVLRPLLQV